MTNLLCRILPILCLCSCSGSRQNTDTLSETVRNPIVDYGADPWVIRDGDMFHYCYSKRRAIYVKSVKRISELNAAEEHRIWQAPETGPYSKEVWAPELHRLGDNWYVYFAADDGENANHRMYVLSSAADLPHSDFEFVGQITDASNKWAIDGTVLTLNDKMYFVWSGWEGDVNEAQHLYIAEMENPATIKSERVRLSSPEFEWEKRGSDNGLPTINEGPQILRKDDRLFIVYSASGSWSNYYCLGMLELTGEDPMLPAAWEKHPEPVFSGTEEVFSPGHASFIEIGEQDYIIYHAYKFKDGGWDSREVRIQPFSWGNGRPNFGKPFSNDVELKILY